MLSYDDPDVEGDPDVAAAEILGYSMEMAADRKANPRDDIVTKLVHADVDGHELNDDEFGYFVIILTVAGNETTRNAITHGMNAFLDNPDQWELWKRERPETMVDEVIRWATPVSSFQRTALNDVEVGGVQVKKGQRVGLFYASANFDDDVFDDPYTFDITRDPNPHVAFGGHGAHYCIGANLARQEVKLMFNALADLAPDIAKMGEPTPAALAAGSTGSRTCRSSTPEGTGVCGLAQIRNLSGQDMRFWAKRWQNGRPGRGQSRAVSTTGPLPVIATVCSMCAPREPSVLRRVQPSGSV